MAEDKKSFVVYSDWYGVFKEIPDDLAGKLIKHIFSYVNDENPKSDDFMINALFSQIKSTLKRDLEKWESQKKQRSEAGKRSAEQRKATKSNERSISLNEQQRKSTVNCNMLDVNVNDFLLEKETKGENQDFLQSEISEEKEINQSVNLETSQKEKSCAKKEKAQPPDLDTFVVRAREIYQNEIKIDFTPYEFAVKAKYQSWIDAGWKDGNKKPIQNWINKLRNTIPHLKPIYGTHNNTKQSNSNGSGYSTGRNESYQGGKTSFNQILARKLKASSDSESGNITIDAEVVERR